MLKPKLCVLDETDSGLDIDALKVVANGVNKLRSDDRSFLIITHYQRLLDHIAPDHVHVLMDGKIIKSGGPELALELEKMAMITSIKDLIGFFLQKIDVQKLDKSEGNKKMAIRKSAIEKFFEKDFEKDAYKYFGSNDLEIEPKVLSKNAVSEKLIKTIRIHIPHLFNNPGFCATIIDGEFCESLSCLPENVKIIHFRDFDEKAFAPFLNTKKSWDNPAALVNVALANSGFMLEATRSSSQEKITINHINSSNTSGVEHMRNIYSFKKNAKLTIIENFYNLHEPVSRVNNTVSQWILEEDAVVNLYSVNSWQGTSGSKNVTSSFIYQKKNSVTSFFNSYTEANSIKNNVHALLEEEHAICNLYSISLLNKSNCVEHDIFIEHLKKIAKASKFTREFLATALEDVLIALFWYTKMHKKHLQFNKTTILYYLKNLLYNQTHN